MLPCKQAFDQLADVPDEKPVFKIESRKIAAVRRAGGVIWFDFRELCGGPRSQNDYLEIATPVPHRAAVECALHAGEYGLARTALYVAD